MRIRKTWLIAIACGPIAIIIALALSRLPTMVEHWYSRSWYPVFSAVWGWLPNALPIPVFPLIALAVALAGLAVLARGILRLIRPNTMFPRRAWARRLGIGLVKLFAIISVVIAFFELAWGYNYLRQPWAVSHNWQTGGGSRTDLLALATRLAKAMQSDCAALPRNPAGQTKPLKGKWDDADLLWRVNLSWDRAALGDPILQGHSGGAKAMLVPGFWSSFGIAGICIPFTHEALVNTGPRNYAIPFAAAHEIAHQRGWAREDEANFIAFWVLHDSAEADLRYSAYAAAFSLVLATGLDDLTDQERADLRAVLPPAYLLDRQAEYDYWKGFRGPMTEVGGSVNDAYLKAQGQADGIKSYGRMVDLLLAWNKQ